jgi:hypothetical protein
MLKKWKIIKVFTLLVFIFVCINNHQTAKGLEIDQSDTVTNVLDGESFRIVRDEVRLADIDAPEFIEEGYQNATEKLRQMIEGRKIFLDLDHRTGRDPYGRLIAVAYIEHNSTHLLNINEALIKVGTVIECDTSENDFNPNDWQLFIKKTSTVYEIKNLETSNCILEVTIEGSGTSDPGYGSHTFLEGSNVVVNAVPSEGWLFNKCMVNGVLIETIPFTVIMDQNHKVEVFFIRDPQSCGLRFNILDEDGNQVREATINSTLQPQKQRQILTKTDLSGSISIDGVFKGEYEFSISKPGYLTEKVSVNLDYQESKTKNIVLEWAPLDFTLTIKDEYGLPVSEVSLLSINQPTNQDVVSGKTSEQGKSVFMDMKPGFYEFSVLGRWIKNRTISIDVPINADDGILFSEIVQRTSTLIMFFEDESDDFNYISYVNVLTLEVPEGQEALSLEMNSGEKMNELLPGSYTFEFSREEFEPKQVTYVLSAGEVQQYIVLSRSVKTNGLGSSSLLILMFTFIPSILFIQKRKKVPPDSSLESTETEKLFDDLEEEPVADWVIRDEIDYKVELPDIPKYWATDKGAIIEAAVVFGLRTFEEIMAVQNMDEKQLQILIDDMLSSGELIKLDTGFLIREDIQEQWKKYFK